MTTVAIVTVVAKWRPGHKVVPPPKARKAEGLGTLRVLDLSALTDAVGLRKRLWLKAETSGPQMEASV